MWDCVTGEKIDSNFGCIMADEMVLFLLFCLKKKTSSCCL